MEWYINEKEDNNKAIALAEEAAKEEIKNIGVLEMADGQAETLIKGILEDAVPKNYDFEVIRKWLYVWFLRIVKLSKKREEINGYRFFCGLLLGIIGIHKFYEGKGLLYCIYLLRDYLESV